MGGSSAAIHGGQESGNPPLQEDGYRGNNPAGRVGKATGEGTAETRVAGGLGDVGQHPETSLSLLCLSAIPSLICCKYGE